jgi:hypothetical protein
LYVPLPLTATAEPTCVPPLVQLVGAAACGPNTVKVIVPPAPLAAPVNVEAIDGAVIAVPGVLLAGPPAVTLVVFVTVVDVMPAPHALLEALLPESPL